MVRLVIMFTRLYSVYDHCLKILHKYCRGCKSKLAEATAHLPQVLVLHPCNPPPPPFPVEGAAPEQPLQGASPLLAQGQPRQGSVLHRRQALPESLLTQRPADCRQPSLFWKKTWEENRNGLQDSPPLSSIPLFFLTGVYLASFLRQSEQDLTNFLDHNKLKAKKQNGVRTVRGWQEGMVTPG